MKRTVRVVRHEFSTRFCGLDARGVRQLRRTATAAGCEVDGVDWIVYSSRVEKVLAALRTAGVDLEGVSHE